MAFDYFSKARMQYILTKIKGLFGQANCIASLDANAKLDSSQIPTNVIKTSSTSGLVKNDGTIDTTSYQPTEAGKGLSTNDYDNTAKDIVDGVTTNLATKADKVTNATNGNLAGLDSNGNLTDSGIASSEIPIYFKIVNGAIAIVTEE